MSTGPNTSSVRVTFHACNGPLRSPRLSNQFAIPGPRCTDFRCRQPWAKIIPPIHRRATKSTRLMVLLPTLDLPRQPDRADATRRAAPRSSSPRGAVTERRDEPGAREHLYRPLLLAVDSQRLPRRAPDDEGDDAVGA